MERRWAEANPLPKTHHQECRNLAIIQRACFLRVFETNWFELNVRTVVPSSNSLDGITDASSPSMGLHTWSH